jgi:hypothetical protein
MGELIGPAETGLDTLAERINLEHELCQTSFRVGLAHAIEAGRLLCEAKQRLAHGQWLPWLGAHCTFSERTAQGYMRVARHAAELTADPQRVADSDGGLSLRGALEMLARPGDADAPAEAKPTETGSATAKLALLIEGLRREHQVRIEGAIQNLDGFRKAMEIIRALDPDGFDGHWNDVTDHGRRLIDISIAAEGMITSNLLCLARQEAVIDGGVKRLIEASRHVLGAKQLLGSERFGPWVKDHFADEERIILALLSMAERGITQPGEVLSMVAETMEIDTDTARPDTTPHCRGPLR